MNRKASMAIPLIALALGLCLAACDNPAAGTRAKDAKRDSTVTVKIGFGVSAGKAAKTIVPGLAAATTSIAVTVSSGSITRTKTVKSAGASASFAGLEAGEWDISAVAYDDETKIGSGSLADVAVSAGSLKSVSVPIKFTGYAGSTDGDLDIELSWPVSTGAGYLEWTLDGTAMTAPAVTTGATAYTARLSAEEVPAGSRSLVLTFRRGSSTAAVLGTFVEVVNIVAGMTSDRWIDAEGTLRDTMSFAEDNFFDSGSTLESLVFDGAAMDSDYGAGTAKYYFTALPAGAFSFTLVPGVAGQSISYTWGDAAGTWDASSTTDKKVSSPLAIAAAGTNRLVVTVVAPDRTTTGSYTFICPFITGTASFAAMADDLSGDYTLEVDIDTTTDGDLTPISGGYATTTGFSGTFDGNGHTIKYQNSTSTNKCVGLFGNIYGGVVKNLHVVCDINITASNSYVGAIAGQNLGTITNCSSSGTITAPNYSLAGGLVGQCGRSSQAGSISGCFSTVDINGGSSVGGLVGALGDGSGSTATITNCYARGNVSGTSSVGGLVGDQRTTGTVTNCYAAGTVTGTSSVGGLVGSSSGTITRSYYSTNIFTGTTTNGSGLTTVKMKDSANYTEWDFADVWGIDTTTPINSGYPYLVYFKNNTTVYE
jgi:hypothetical protein